MEGRKRKFIKELLQKPSVRRESGLYVADGLRICEELPPELVEELYVTDSFLQSPHSAALSAVLKKTGYLRVTQEEMKQISDTVTPQGVMALVRQKRIRGISALLSEGRKAGAPLLVLLETIQDPGNLGTILRAAEAAGATGILMNRGCADIYSPKVVRSTMGAIFRVPFLLVEDLFSAAEGLKAGSFSPDGAGIKLFAAHLSASEDYAKVSYQGGCGIMIGNEARGLSGELTALSDVRIRIPMCGSVESLNAAMAATILLFEANRQRRLGA